MTRARGPRLHPLMEQLTAIRDRKGITRADVARHMRVNAAGIKDADDGITRPLISTFAAYADAIGVEIRLVDKETPE